MRSKAPSHTAPSTESRGGTRKKKDKGGDSAWDPPLPIPNREVKPRRADGTAKAGEQVAAPLMKGRGPGTQVQGPLPFFMPGRKFPAIPGRRHNDAGCKPRWVVAVNFNVQGDGNVWITSGIYAVGAGMECTTGSIGDAMNSRLYTALRRDGNISRMSWIIAGIGRNLEFMVMQRPYLIINNKKWRPCEWPP